MRQTSTGAKEKPTTTRTGPAAAWLAALSRLRRRIATAPPSMDGPSSPNGVGQSNRSLADAKDENLPAERSRQRPAKAMPQTRARSVTP